MINGTASQENDLDSEDTIINDLQDSVNCTQSKDFSNTPSIRMLTSSITQTVQHIEQRLEKASKRVGKIDTL
jgi:hypothetical protein